ncbi:MAG TPA: RHS repeat-associated core domain-containing protein [Gemmatimonadaceae bacterium]|nr:RHS repeat-associated core domain-containing protein [Gemmatimonadaceae bacterium]
MPQSIPKTWTTPGTYTVLAKGFNDCPGQATTTVTVTSGTPDPAPVVAADLTPAASSLSLPAPSGLESDDSEGVITDATAVTDDETSSWLTNVTIYVDLNGSGSGTVTGSAACSGVATTGCAASVASGAGLTLTAAATAGSVFTGWSGACTGTSATCTLTAFDHALAVANFRAAPAPVLQYYHVDTLGSVRAVTDASGTVLERHDYRPFGEDNQALPAPGANPARFLGQPRDQTKLDYFGARYLDMHTGRFTRVDPVLSPAALFAPQKFNRYAYAENNPLRYMDPTGTDDWGEEALAESIGSFRASIRTERSRFIRGPAARCAEILTIGAATLFQCHVWPGRHFLGEPLGLCGSGRADATQSTTTASFIARAP